MQLSKHTRQVIGAAIGGALAAMVSTGLGLSSTDRQTEPARTLEQPAPQG